MTSDGGLASTAAQPKPAVQSAARAVGILVEVAKSENGLTAKEISERFGIGRQATYHLMRTLVSVGALTRSAGRRYVLGLRIGIVAEGFGRQLDPAEQLAPMVREVVQRTGETSYATGWWANEITILAVARGTSPVRAGEVSQGHIGDAHARASGKLLLAFAPPSVRRQFFESHELSKLTENTRTDVNELEEHFAQIREQGYAEDLEEVSVGLCCLAVPLTEAGSPFALSISAPSERFRSERDHYLEDLYSVARLGA